MTAVKAEGKATESMLSELHGVMTKMWLKKLSEDPETLSPAELNTIRQFLKDNNISCDFTTNEEVTKLIDALPAFSRTEAMGL